MKNTSYNIFVFSESIIIVTVTGFHKLHVVLLIELKSLANLKIKQ